MRRLQIDLLVGLTGVVMAACSALPGRAQTADQAWLSNRSQTGRWIFPSEIRALGSDAVEQSALEELRRGLKAMVPTLDDEHGTNAGQTARSKEALAGQTVVGTAAEVHREFPSLPIPSDLESEGYWLYSTHFKDHPLLLIVGADQRGVLYGAYALLRHRSIPGAGSATDNIHEHPIRSHPAIPIRWVDEWDNPDGSIERGYAGRSIFFEGGKVREDLKPVAEYARLLASIGINGCNVNNVNAAPQFIDADHLKQLARVADAMRPWGVRLAMSVDVASPQKIGGLATFDPLDPAVKAWWAAKVDEIYALIPDFAGFTVKADSEGQPGPSSFGRTPADAANTLAAALEPHGGVVLYRAFVYNHHLDWHDSKADRARAAYDIFHPLDGKFAANVIIQTKEGPIDFQAREPVSPLFAGLEKTSQALELQITQEYTGQQRHLVYLAPMWKQVLDFDFHAGDKATPVKQVIAGTTFHRPLGGMVGVAGVGRERWLGSPLALANLYAFGRLAWDPELKPEQIAAEWASQTFNADRETVGTITKMLMQSWPTYESYTGPLGMQTLTDITGSHYGPGIESSERNGWGQWHWADAEGVGMDRTVATGTGYAGQYPPHTAKIFESLESCPDELLLFFHHVPYSYKLHSGKTVIQHIYDTHYQGAAQAAQFVAEWQTLRGKVDPVLYDDILNRLEYQAGHAIVWRDAIVQYFYKLSGIADERGRAGHYPGRLEAENAKLVGYKTIEVTPWEDASGGKAVGCDVAQCSAEWGYAGPAGRYDIAVQYFDLQGGSAQFALTVNGRMSATWIADAVLPSKRPNGDSSTRHTLHGIDLKPGDVLRVEGTPDKEDPAALDYVELVPQGIH